MILRCRNLPPTLTSTCTANDVDRHVLRFSRLRLENDRSTRFLDESVFEIALYMLLLGGTTKISAFAALLIG